MLDKILYSLAALILLYIVLANYTDANNTLNGLGSIVNNEVSALQGGTPSKLSAA